LLQLPLRPKGYNSFLLILSLPPILSSLVNVEYESTRHSEGTEVVVFDLVGVAKALAQYDYSLGALM